jgi:hypothetical protein
MEADQGDLSQDIASGLAMGFNRVRRNHDAVAFPGSLIALLCLILMRRSVL